MRLWKLAQGLSCTGPSTEGDGGCPRLRSGEAAKGSGHNISPKGLAPRSRLSMLSVGKSQSKITQIAAEGAAPKGKARFHASLPGKADSKVQIVGTAKTKRKRSSHLDGGRESGFEESWRSRGEVAGHQDQRRRSA